MEMEMTEYMGPATVVPMNTTASVTTGDPTVKKVHCMDFAEGDVVTLSYPEYPEEKPKIASIARWGGELYHSVAVSADLAPVRAPKKVITKIARLEVDKTHPKQMHFDFELGGEE